MGLERIVHKAVRENHLFSVLLELTFRCNLDCFFCYNDRELEGIPLRLEQYLSLLDHLHRMGVLNLILSGGEPLAHPHFFAIGSRARELGFLVRVKSNGHILDRRVASRLQREVDPFVIDISLHGARAETHDRQTRVAGSFERLMANLDVLRELDLRLKLNCTLTRWNEEEIEGMFAIADRLGVHLAVNPTVAPRDNGDTEPLEIAPSREGMLRLYRLQDERAQKRQRAVEVSHQADEFLPVAVDKNCGAGSSGVTVDPYGNVLPCVQWRRPLGNLHEHTILDIWHGSAALGEVRDLTVEAKRMVDGYGARGKLMSFCPGLAQVTTGDPLTVYDSGLRQMETLHQVGEEKSARRRPGIPLPIVS